jgi:hypothetical protein
MHLLWPVLQGFLHGVPNCNYCARFGVLTRMLVKNRVLWDMTSHPGSLEYAVMVLWHIVCNVAARFFCVFSEGIDNSSLHEC